MGRGGKFANRMADHRTWCHAAVQPQLRGGVFDQIKRGLRDGGVAQNTGGGLGVVAAIDQLCQIKAKRGAQGLAASVDDFGEGGFSGV